MGRLEVDAEPRLSGLRDSLEANTRHDGEHGDNIGVLLGNLNQRFGNIGTLAHDHLAQGAISQIVFNDEVHG